jgi:protein Tex
VQGNVRSLPFTAGFFHRFVAIFSISRVNRLPLDPGSGAGRAAQLASQRLVYRAPELLFRISGGFMDSINSRIAEELGVRPQQVEAAVA